MKKIVLSILFLCCLFPNNILANEKIEVKFSECVDGDTAKVVMNDEIVKIRFLAIDTPETKHPTKGKEEYGKEASEYTCNKLKGADKIILEFDSESDKKDKYDRYLVWVFVDNSLLQKELIKNGLAEVDYIYGDYKYVSELQKVQDKAKEKNIGIWKNNKTFSLQKYVKNLDLKTKIIITVGIILLFILFLYIDKKFRKKVVRKTKNNVKKEIKKNFNKYMKK